jgi:hypothetical protein
VENVTRNFKFIIKITTLQTRIKLPGGNICAHSVLSESLMTECRVRVDTGLLRIVSSLCVSRCTVGCSLELPVGL